MLVFSNICKYNNGYDFIWSGRIAFPSELTGASFVDAWAIIPAAGTVNYDVTAKFITSSVKTDWTETGTAVAVNGYAEVPQAAAKRNMILARFTATYTTTQINQLLRLYNTGSSSGISGAYWMLRFTLSNYELSNVSLSSLCRDDAITITWNVMAQTVYFIEVLDEAGAVVYTATTNSTEKMAVIPAGKLQAGNHTIRVQAGYDLSSKLNSAGAGVQTAIVELPVTIWRIEPKIIAFEPEGVAQNRQQPIAITWASENQQSYVLKVKQGGQVVKEYSGTTATTATIPANTLQSGLTTLELKLKYTPTWGTEADAVYTTKTISFETYGTPETPVFTSGPTYDTAYPIITWTTTEQYYYRVRILSGQTNIQDSGLVPSAVGSHKVKDPLPSGSYTIEIIIRSEYDLTASASQVATIAFAEPEAPAVSLAADSSRGAITVSLQAYDGTNPTESLELFRREIGGSWIRIAKGLPSVASYVDYAIASEKEYSYLARAIGSKGGYKDSEPVTSSVFVPYTQLSDVNDLTNYIELRLEPDKQETAVRGTHLMTVAGCSAPRVEYSDEQYRTLDCSFFVPARDANRLVDLYYSAAMLLFRDNRGRKLFGCISSYPKRKDSDYGWAVVQFTFTELDHREAV